MSDADILGAAERPDPQQRLAAIVEMMREMSRQTDPDEMVRDYGRRTAAILHRDRLISLSRRGHAYPLARVTRDTARTENINPWTQRDRLPIVHGGLLAELIYGDQPRIIDRLEVPDDDPSAPYVAGMRSLMALPLYDQGVALNMVILLRRAPDAYRNVDLAQQVWIANLFGRATHNLVLTRQLKDAYEEVDRDLRSVASIQRSLLPAELPSRPGLDLAAHYQTSRRAGGDYYDLFPLPGDQLGILIADVSGHGTSAAVMMAITHALAHTHPDHPCPPGRLITRLNRQLARFYTNGGGHFITAFYGIYDPHTRVLTYTNAGHNPPRLKRCADGSLFLLDQVGSLPLGIEPNETFTEATQELQTGDQIIFYTDGITEAFDPAGEMFGIGRLDDVLANCALTARGLIDEVLRTLAAFTQGAPADDDRTLLVAKVT